MRKRGVEISGYDDVNIKDKLNTSLFFFFFTLQQVKGWLMKLEESKINCF